MAELMPLLKMVSRGEKTLEQVKSELETLVAQSPSRVPDLTADLERAQELGFPPNMCKLLRDVLDETDGADATMVPGASASFPSQQGGGGSPPSAERADPDATVLGSSDSSPVSSFDPNATLAATPEQMAIGKTRRPPEQDPDATVVGSAEDLAPARASSPHPDRTVLAPGDGSDQGDATVLASEDDGGAKTELTAAGRSPAPSAGDETVVAAPDEGAEPTQAERPAAGADDETALADRDATGVEASGGDPTASGGGDFDIFSAEAMQAAEEAAKATTGGTGASWPTDAPGAGQKEIEFKEGYLLRGRFKLQKKLGEGGMGAVWQGIDELKVAAKSRNPEVAIKLLQGDFKEHPESFIALQRETEKQQRLAHPNIATVYDFDRDTDTGTVFMTMEVLNGNDLAAEIRRLPRDGLSLAEAMPYIADLCEGLKHAHAHGLVHSDLKPGNCFVHQSRGQDGSPTKIVKLLDFGIARASKTKADESGETTVFDPGELGALTPTYATVEMFEGIDPDPRDDIYALAIMTYQLLTGKHPYSKQSAPKAMAAKLEPAPVPGLTKRQNRALRRALEFLRENRTPTVEEFFEGLSPKKSYALHWTLGSVGLAAVLALALIGPIRDWIWSNRTLPGYVERVQDCVAASESSCIVQTMQEVEEQHAERFRVFKEDERIKNPIVDFYEGLLPKFWNPSNELYDYQAAVAKLEELKSPALYPDRAEYLDVVLRESRNQVLSQLSSEYVELLDEGMLIPLEARRDITDVLDIVKQIDPEHQLLSDAELPIKYADFVETAIAEEKWKVAKAYLDASVAYAPDDPRLANLSDTVETELQRMLDREEIAAIQTRLQAEYQAFQSLSDFQGVRDDLIRLSDLDPENELLLALQKILRNAFESELTALIGAKKWPESEALLADFAKLLDIAFITEKRNLLTAAEREAGYEMEVDEARVAERIESVKKLLADPQFTSEWEMALKEDYKELIALLPPGAERLEPIRAETAKLHRAEAAKAREAGRFTRAREFLANGERFYPDFAGFAAERGEILAAEEALRKQQEEERRLARINKLKQQVLADAQANAPTEAIKKLDALREELPADDPFLTAEGAQAVALAFYRLAEERIKQEKWGEAIRFHKAGYDLAPDLPELAAQHEIVAEQQAKRALIVEVEETLSKGSLLGIDYGQLKKDIAKIKQDFPDEASAQQQRFDSVMKERFQSLYQKDSLPEKELLAAYEVQKRAQTAFPFVAGMKLPPLPCGEDCRAVVELIKSRKLSEAEKALAEVGAKHGADHPDVQKVAKALDGQQGTASGYHETALAALQKGGRQALTIGFREVEKALELWTDSSSFVDTRKKLVAAIEATDPAKCSAGKAGQGASARGGCYDMVGNEKGPFLAVIPAGNGVSKEYAIGTQEVSVDEYNTVCQQSKKCTPVKGKKNLPVTGVSIHDVEGFLAALSEQTGETYRLPTEAEWEHAASAEGRQPSSMNVNCEVKGTDGSLLKGKELANVKSRDKNGWGLVHYVGNAQELVKSGSALKVRGGSHKESLSRCELSLSDAHNGAADPVTGFRILRELN